MAAPPMRLAIKRRTTSLLIPVLVVLMVSSLPHRVEARQCPDKLTTIIGGTPIDNQLACSGVVIAREFLSRLGVKSQSPVKIIVSDTLLDVHGVDVLGTYDQKTNTITIPSLGIAQASNAQDSNAQPSCLGMQIDHDMYRSFVVHEMTHAIAHQTGLMSPTDHVSHEYLAYAVQIATLPPPRRNRILTQHDLDGFSADDEISLIYLMLGPDQFAVKSYLHFARPENGKHFVRRISKGSFHPAG